MLKWLDRTWLALLLAGMTLLVWRSTGITANQLEDVRVSFAADSALYAPHFIAIEKGYYAEEGIRIIFVHAGGGVATPALMSGRLPYSTSAASALSAIMRGAKAKIIYTNADRPSYELWSSSEDIKTLADLKGKAVGIQTRGDTMEIATRILLRVNNIDPNSVIYMALGYGGARLAAIRSGSVPAAILGVSDAVQLRGSMPKGHRLADTKKDVNMLYMGLATSNQELEQTRERAKRFLRGTVKGREYFKAFKEETVQILTKYNRHPDRVNAINYDDTLSIMTEAGSMPLKALQNDAKLRAEILGIPENKIRPVEEMYDYSLVQEIYRELKQKGWQPQR